MKIRVCPWWLSYVLHNPLRHWLHNPDRMLAGLVQPGQTVVDIGCGPGHFTLGMARLVGEAGKVIAVDVQPQMLDVVRRRAARAGLLGRIQLHQCTPARLDLESPVDFALAFWMVHEVPDSVSFLCQVAALLKPGARFLLVEPRLHVTGEQFSRTVQIARAAGLQPCAEPGIMLSRAVLLTPA
jgi:ubiquinone/menaquinone biosynthesis C-methylase UbiE